MCSRLHRIVSTILAGSFLFGSTARAVDRVESPPPSGAAPVASGPQYAGLSPEEAPGKMILPTGFKALLVAGEPDVQQPIAMTIDDRGRLWVAESYSYPLKRKPAEGKDRILIFEDTDGDGKADVRKVFQDKLDLVSGLEVGFGGVWVGQAPELLFIPDRNGDDVPDSAPEVLLDGWGFEDTHETLNSFIWGPDGWLYGCHGVFTHSRVGKPGTPDDQRIPLNAGIWRYHPQRHQFEVFAHGTSNPWGVDFNDYGQSFLTCCVIPHLFHIIQGARYHRQGGQHFNPYTYADIPTIAEHRHWVGNQWHNPDRAASSGAGGGHAHAGAMIYLADDWPAEYRNQLIMNNIHGSRLNMDLLSPRGSGYVGNAAPDFLFANDKWSQMLYLRYGPDGQVYIIDWYDKNECHHREDQGHDRSNGRIFKVVYGNPQPAHVDLQKLSDEELVDLQLHRNDWYVRQSRRILQERGASDVARSKLVRLATSHEDPTRRLRALWTLHVTGGVSPDLLLKSLQDDNPYIRGWAIQLATELGTCSPELLVRFEDLAQSDDSPIVRLYLASAVQRIPLEQRWTIVDRLSKHAEDLNDHNLPLMNWYALEPLVPVDCDRAVAIAESSPFTQLLPFTLRRIGADGSEASVNDLVDRLEKVDSPDRAAIYLTAIQQALQGKREFPEPENWKNIAAKYSQHQRLDLALQSRVLSLTFGDVSVLDRLREWITDQKQDLSLRRSALQNLLQFRDVGAASRQQAAVSDKNSRGAKLRGLIASKGIEQAQVAAIVSLLQNLLDDEALRRDALRGLATIEDEKTPGIILDWYPKLSGEERRDALNTLAARVPFAQKLIAAVEQDRVPRQDLSADLIRQLANLKNEDIDAKLTKVWGIVRQSSEERRRMIDRYRRMVGQPDFDNPPDIHLGRAIFQKTCAQCHNLFGIGGAIGPELTGSNRANIDYLLSNVLDPSAVMAREYQPLVVALKDGRIITGLPRERTANSLKIQSANELVTLSLDDIEEEKLSEQSMMPDNLWQNLSSHDVQSLVAYLGQPAQVPMLANADNLPSFYNGLDLTGWTGNADLWRVENGEIVGSAPNGIKRNEFLRSQLMVADFELSLQVKLTPNTENSGIQFRSKEIEDAYIKGYQADIGKGWWGKIYDEHGTRGVLSKVDGDQHVKPDDWNDYRIIAIGPRLQTWLNGRKVTDIEDPIGEKRGIIALQIHSGKPLEIRFRNLNLNLNPAFPE